MSIFHLNTSIAGDAKRSSGMAAAAQQRFKCAAQPLLGCPSVAVHPSDALFTTKVQAASNVQNLPRYLRQRSVTAGHYTCIRLPAGKDQAGPQRLASVGTAADFNSKAVINEQRAVADPAIIGGCLCTLTHAARPA